MTERLLIGLLGVALIPAIILAVLLTRSAASSLEDSAREGLAKAARSTAARVDHEVEERRAELQTVAAGGLTELASDLEETATSAQAPEHADVRAADPRGDGARPAMNGVDGPSGVPVRSGRRGGE